MTIRGIRVGVPICEDIWLESPRTTRTSSNASPRPARKSCGAERLALCARQERSAAVDPVARVTESGLPLVYLNQVGGQDELVFDGASFALNADLRSPRNCRRSRKTSRPCSGAGRRRLALLRAGGAGRRRRQGRLRACVLGVRDYVGKNGFPGVLLGVSGGIDSALVRGDRGRCARRRAGPRRDAAVSLHRAGIARRRGKTPKALGIRYEVTADRDAVNGFEKISVRAPLRACRATSPKRICRRAPAAHC